jgi:hypothetical protein
LGLGGGADDRTDEAEQEDCERTKRSSHGQAQRRFPDIIRRQFWRDYGVTLSARPALASGGPAE